MSTISLSMVKNPSDMLVSPRSLSGDWKSPSNVKGSSSVMPSCSTSMLTSMRKWYESPATWHPARPPQCLGRSGRFGAGTGVAVAGCPATTAVGSGVGVLVAAGVGVAVGSGVGVAVGAGVGDAVGTRVAVGAGAVSSESPPQATIAATASSAAIARTNLIMRVAPAWPQSGFAIERITAFSIVAHPTPSRAYSQCGVKVGAP